MTIILEDLQAYDCSFSLGSKFAALSSARLLRSTMLSECRAAVAES